MKSALSDYLILQSSKADMTKATSGIMTFYIDNQYYSNTRGSVCDVKMIMCNASIDVAFNDCCIIDCDLALQNAYNNENDVFNPFQIISDSVATSRIGEIPNYRTRARPQKISIRLRSIDGTPFDLTQDNFGAFFIFEFTYKDVEKEISNYVGENYKFLL